MPVIVFNQPLKNQYYLLKIDGEYHAEMGQFYMIRVDSQAMFLARPMSIHDIAKDGILFLYQVSGKGTAALASCKPGDHITVHGPYGHGFPSDVTGHIALVGGATGIAPLFYTVKQLRKINRISAVDIYLGLHERNEFEDGFRPYADFLKIDYGGFITDHILYERYQVIFSCGPESMMKKIEHQAKTFHIAHYISLERRMACGVGACLVCSCQTMEGNKRVCREGPVFRGEEIFYHE